MTEWFDARAERSAKLSPNQKRKVRQIKDALGRSDHTVYDHFFSLDTFERSAKKAKTGRVTAEWPRRIDGLYRELLLARDRLDDLHTGLRAQGQLRRALGLSAEAMDHWRDALRSQDPQEIDRLSHRMQSAFVAAETAGRRGKRYLEQGR